MPAYVIADGAYESLIAPLLQDLPKTLEVVTADSPIPLAVIARGVARLSIVNETSMHASYRPSTSEIEISIGLIEVLWAYAYAFETLSAKFAGAQALGQPVPLPVDNETDCAIALFNWAAGRQAGRDVGSLGDLAALVVSVEPSTLDVAGQQALIAGAFVVCHELAHHYLRHHCSDIEQEREADALAGEVLLSRYEKATELEFCKARGSAVALLFLACAGVHTGQLRCSTHPAGYRRLVGVLEPHVGVEADEVWAFVAVMLDLSMQMAGVRIERVARDGWHQWLDDLIDALSRRE